MNNTKRLLKFFVGFVISSIICAANVNAQDISSIKFAHLTDVHIDAVAKKLKNQRLYPYSAKLLTDAVSQINADKSIELVVFSGDITNSPNPKNLNLFVKIANKLNVRWYTTPGNHDIGGTGPFYKKTFFEKLHQANNAIPENQYYYAVQPKNGYVFLMMNGVPTNRITANGYFPKEELDWLDNQLYVYNNQHVVIVQHYPLVEPFASKDHFIINNQEYLNVLGRHKNVIAILSGHYHGTKLTLVGNIVHVSTPALIEYPDAFRVITITEKPNKFVFKFDFKETGLKDLQAKSKALSKSPALHYGKETDRNAVIDVPKH